MATQDVPDYIMGTVQSSQGTEAGVWVIAETDDLPTNFIKIVVTDDDGRFVLPELPDALYSVWVRGYGLVDSTPVTVRPGADLTLTATVARTPRGCTPPTTGIRCLRYRLAASSRERGRKGTASHRT